MLALAHDVNALRAPARERARHVEHHEREGRTERNADADKNSRLGFFLVPRYLDIGERLLNARRRRENGDVRGETASDSPHQNKGGLCRVAACLAENSFGGGGASGGWDLPHPQHRYREPWTPPVRADVPPSLRPLTKPELLSALDRVLLETLRALDAARGANAGVGDLSASGREVVKNGLTRAGRAYQKHMGRGELPSVAGRDLNSAGQNLLDEILMNPQTKQIAVPSGNFSGGTRFIAPNGIGATFDPKGVFQYFGVYP